MTRTSDLDSKGFTAFAPATVANVAVGFDILGFALQSVGDRVTVRAQSSEQVTIEEISGLAVAKNISLDPSQNTAGVPLIQMLRDLKPGFGFSVRIEKGIPLGSGLGGSAASAVGAVVAVHALLRKEFLKEDLSPDQLIHYALEGEAIASGAKHADNVAPCLLGGLTLSRPGEHPDVVSLPCPKSVFAVVVNPSMQLNTKDARGVLKSEISLKMHSQQSARLAAFIAGCCTSDLALLKKGFEDLVVEPQRAHLIPGFFAVKQAAMDAGVLGCSISGAGPSVFALTSDQGIALNAKQAMIAAFKSAGLDAQGWISPMGSAGARIV